jgi:hypothetical protein
MNNGLGLNGTKICLQLGYYERLWDLQVMENNKKMEALGLRTLADSVRSSNTNASSQKRSKQTSEKDLGEGSDSSYLPRADEGQEDKDGSVFNSLEKVSSHTWLGVSLH